MSSGGVNAYTPCQTRTIPPDLTRLARVRYDIVESNWSVVANPP
jgi:hypothetical protein